MKSFISIIFFALTCAFGHLGAATDSAVAEILDAAIWWPGDYGQICKGDSTAGPFDAPPIEAYGTIVQQEYFLSEKTIANLSAQRDAVVAEIVSRLKSFTWEKFPPAPKPPERVTALEKAELAKHKGEIRPWPGPWQPQNPRVLGGSLLRIIEALEVVEALPELIRLEESLNALNDEAIIAMWAVERVYLAERAPPKIYVPAIEIGGSVIYDSYLRDVHDEENIRAKPWIEWKSRVFGNIVFQREMLGVGLGLLEKRKYAPLKKSYIGRLAQISSQVPWSTEIRAEALALINGFLKKDANPPLESHKVVAAELLAKAVSRPGDWNQMCLSPTPIPAAIPLPAHHTLILRHFNLSDKEVDRLQAYRNEVMPLLRDALSKIQIQDQPEPKLSSEDSGQSLESFGPIILNIVRELNATACLAEILRLEADLHKIIARAEAGPAYAVPSLPLDSSLTLVHEPKEQELPAPERERRYRLAVCKIYQRELLALMRTLLVQDSYEPGVTAKWQQAHVKAGEEALRSALEKWPEITLKPLNEIHSHPEIPMKLRLVVGWDYRNHRAKINLADLPYTEALRREIRDLAAALMNTIPGEINHGAKGMPLSGNRHHR